ncbi:MAG: MBL fold metallo-hydrolase [Paracoccaceae bacterium]|jgi:glyoxylase-like metal-dependent hydrolase (beta-lactamase superfamily II)|nr:MBL fold metallo-hydrolase [Paracoccaceae bacterium]
MALAAGDRAENRAHIDFPWATPPAEGTATEVAEGVLWLRLPLPMKLDHVNVFALDDGEGWTLVDAGLDWPRGRAAWEAALAGPLSGRPVRRVLVTHYHPDHVGLAGWFRAEHGAEIVATRTTWLFARMLQLDVQERPAPEAVAFWRRAGMPEAMLAQRMADRPFNFADCTAPLPLGFTRIEEDDTIRAAGRVWDVRLGSGHAPDHATLWSRDDGLVLGGDQLLPSISPNLGVYPTEPESDPIAAWFASCRRLAAHARDDQLVLPGHKLPFTGLPARMIQLEQNHVEAIARLRAWLSEAPRTAHECFAPLFGREVGPGEYGLALGEAVGHLNHLLRTGAATRFERPDGAWLWHAT